MRTLLALLLALVAAAAAAPAPAASRGAGAPPLERTRESARASSAAPIARAAALSASRLKDSLRGPMRSAGSRSGAAVVDLTNERALFRLRSGTRRPPASVQKLYTTSTALLRHGPQATLETTVLGEGALDGTTWRGDLFLRGAGDPTFGSRSFTRRKYGAGATTFELAQRLQEAGIERVEGRVFGDAGVFDPYPGVPYSGLSLASRYVGPLSGLAYDRGGGPAFAASQLKTALRGRGVSVTGRTGARAAPAGARALASSHSPPFRTLVALTNRPSDNFFAEMLLKGLGARFGSAGSTAAGAGVVRSTVARFGIEPAVADGSGLSRRNRTSPGELVRLLDRIRAEAEASEGLDGSLPVAGDSGTLAGRMRGTAAEGRCRAKTGTLSGASALAGYCDTQGGELVAFAFLMEGVNVSAARRLQDRMVAAIARYDAD